MKKTLSFIDSVLFGFLALFTLVFNIVEQDYAVGILFFVLYISVAGCCFMSYVFDDDKKDSSASNVAERPMTQSKSYYSRSSEFYSKEEIADIISTQVHRIMNDADDNHHLGETPSSFTHYYHVEMGIDSDCIRVHCIREAVKHGVKEAYSDYLQHFYYRRGKYYWMDIEDKMNNGETIYSGLNKNLPRGKLDWPGDIDYLREYIENYPFDGFKCSGGRIYFDKRNGDNSYI